MPNDAFVVAPVLAADVRNQIRALAEAGALREVVGGAAYHAGGTTAKILRSLLPARFARTEARRVECETPLAAFRPTVWPELKHRFRIAARLRSAGPRATDEWFAEIDRRAAGRIRDRDRLVLAREDGCLASFQAARRVGAVCLYDLPIPHHAELRRALEAEAAEFPQAGAAFDFAEEYDPMRTSRKDAELASADTILVASDYVRDGLIQRGLRPDRIVKIPYGCDGGQPFTPFAARKPIVLCVGHLSLRKGTLRLLRVWKKLGAHRTHTLKFIGKRVLPEAVFAEYSGIFESAPPIPRSRLWVEFSRASVFVFPSACDGFGLVLNEAISCGTPVIASSHTGAPGFIEEARHGWTYPHGDDDALAERLEIALAAPARLAEMAREAYEFAKNRTWAEYRNRFRNAVVGPMIEPT